MIGEFQVYESYKFTKWFTSLKDEKVKARIAKRIDRAKFGNFGDWKMESGGVRAMRIDYGPGYRLYYCIRKNKIIILQCGGDKRNQQADIASAMKILKEL